VAAQTIRSMLFGILDARTYFITGAVLIALTTAATLLPAKRAVSMEPKRARRVNCRRFGSPTLIDDSSFAFISRI
jgi:hypothetical protein